MRRWKKGQAREKSVSERRPDRGDSIHESASWLNNFASYLCVMSLWAIRRLRADQSNGVDTADGVTNVKDAQQLTWRSNAALACVRMDFNWYEGAWYLFVQHCPTRYMLSFAVRTHECATKRVSMNIRRQENPWQTRSNPVGIAREEDILTHFAKTV